MKLFQKDWQQAARSSRRAPWFWGLPCGPWERKICWIDESACAEQDMRGTTGKKYGTRAPKPTYTLLLQLVCVCVCVFSFFPCVLSYFSHVRLFVTLWTISPPVPSFHGDSPHGNTEAVCHAFFQRIFPAQGLNPGSPALQADSLPPNHLGDT